MTSDDPPREHQPRRSAVMAWIIYDVGTTMFFTGVVGLFFPLWVTQAMSGDDATVGFTLAAAMALNLIISPVVGAFSDQARRRMPFLVASTVVCVAMIMALGGDSLNLGLGVFALAVIAANTSVVIYNSLLAEVSTERNRATVGGLGVGIGYLGAITAVAIGLIFVESQGHVFGFRAIGVLFLLASMPLFFLLKERPRPTQDDTLVQRTGSVLKQLKSTLGNIQRFPGLLRFLVARFWYMWSVNTAATFAILYGTETVGFTEREVELVLLLGIFVAIPSGFFWGRVTDKFGPHRALTTVLVGWVFVLLSAAAIPWLGLPGPIWLPVGVFSGILIAGIWVADRPYMLRLAPSEYTGQFFGLHSVTGKLSAMAGPFTWGLLSVTLGLGQIAAVLSLAGSAAIALILLQSVSGGHLGESETMLTVQTENLD
ncbi:MAG: MFS transporter [SAR202 cluster bacterium]|nr:MFS transporter [SAR202 cluster bacterium]